MVVLTQSFLIDAACNGQASGIIQVVASGGVAPYQYSLVGQGVVNTTGNFSGLAAGTYSIVASDSTVPIPQTSPAFSFTISEPTALTGSTSVTGQDITVTATGGNPTYQYSLDGGPLQTSGIFTGVDFGSHTVTVIDSNGCQLSLSVIVDPPVTYGTITSTVLDLVTGTTYNVDCVSGIAPCHPLRFCVQMDDVSYFDAVIANNTTGDYASNLVNIKVYQVDAIPVDLADLDPKDELTNYIISQSNGLCYQFITPDAWIGTSKTILFVYTFQLTVPTNNGDYTYFDRIGYQMGITVKGYDDGTNIVGSILDENNNAIDTVCVEYNDTIQICFDQLAGGAFDFTPVLHIGNDLFAYVSTVVFPTNDALTITDGDITDGQACVEVNTTALNTSDEICVKGVISSDNPVVIGCDCIDLVASVITVSSNANQIVFDYMYAATNANPSAFTTGNFWVTVQGVQYLTTTLSMEANTFPSLFIPLIGDPFTMDVHMDFTYDDGCFYDFDFTLTISATAMSVANFAGESCEIAPVCGSFYAHAWNDPLGDDGIIRFDVDGTGAIIQETLICNTANDWLDMAIRADGTVYVTPSGTNDLYTFSFDTCTQSAAPVATLSDASNGLSFVDADNIAYETSFDAALNVYQISLYNVALNTDTVWATTTITHPQWQTSGDFFIFGGRMYALLVDQVVTRQVHLWDFGVYGPVWDGTEVNLGPMPGLDEFLGGAGANGFAFAVSGDSVWRIDFANPGLSPMIFTTALLTNPRFLGAASIQDTGLPC